MVEGIWSFENLVKNSPDAILGRTLALRFEGIVFGLTSPCLLLQTTYLFIWPLGFGFDGCGLALSLSYTVHRGSLSKFCSNGHGTSIAIGRDACFFFFVIETGALNGFFGVLLMPTPLQGVPVLPGEGVVPTQVGEVMGGAFQKKACGHPCSGFCHPPVL